MTALIRAPTRPVHGARERTEAFWINQACWQRLQCENRVQALMKQQALFEVG
jgi:hypothetical protein